MVVSRRWSWWADRRFAKNHICCFIWKAKRGNLTNSHGESWKDMSFQLIPGCVVKLNDVGTTWAWNWYPPCFSIRLDSVKTRNRICRKKVQGDKNEQDWRKRVDKSMQLKYKQNQIRSKPAAAIRWSANEKSSCTWRHCSTERWAVSAPCHAGSLSSNTAHRVEALVGKEVN